MSERGVVVTLGDGMVPGLLALFSVLRREWTRKQYPIQVIFQTDQLSVESIQRVAVKAKESTKNEYGTSLSTLDVTFVDVTNCVTPEYRRFFGSWGMKLLAYLFNSFEETLLLDADAVPFVDVDTFFKLPQYRDTGALFYRDREAACRLNMEAITLFNDTLLSDEQEREFLRIGGGGDSIKSHFFRKEACHLMESGLFVVNHREKFKGIVMSMVIQFMEPLKKFMHGEKEYIWLGQEMVGNSYAFNKNFAAAVGETLSKDSTLSENGIRPTIYSSHPGHLSDDRRTLLWINSGFLVCKKEDAYIGDSDDVERETTKEWYHSPIKLRSALIPPSPLTTDDGQLGNGWKMTSLCYGYIWAGFDTIPNDPSLKGELVTLSSEQTRMMYILGTLWVHTYNQARGSD